MIILQNPGQFAKRSAQEVVRDPHEVVKRFNAKGRAGAKLRKSVKVEIPLGKKRYSHEEPRQMAYGELPSLVNPDDGDPWDIFIAPDSKKGDRLKIVGWLPQPGKKNHKLILAKNGKLTPHDKTIIAGMAARIPNYGKPVILDKKNKLEVVIKTWKPNAKERKQEAEKMEKVKVLEKAGTFAKAADKIPGGLADKKSPSDFDKKPLSKGVKTELEHTTAKPIATEIAMDHLTEDPEYYKKLEKMEKAADDDAKTIKVEIEIELSGESTEKPESVSGSMTIEGEGEDLEVKINPPSEGRADRASDMSKAGSVLDTPGLLSKVAKKMNGYTQHGNIKGKKKNEVYEAVREDTGDKELAARVANSQTKEAALWDMLGKVPGMAGRALQTPVGAGLAGAGLGGAAGYFGGREQLQEAAEGPFVAMMRPEQFVPALLQGIPPDQQQMILSNPQAMSQLTQQVRREAIQMLGEQVLD